VRVLRIAVVSDTHGHLGAVQKVLGAAGPFDMLLHAGDHYQDGLRLGQALGIAVKAVVGNCDLGVAGPEEELLRVWDRRILLTHGHRYRVKRTMKLLQYRALQVGADVVIFGHTHLPVKLLDGGTLFLNPGSPVWPEGRDRRRTWATLDLGAQCRVEMLTVEPPADEHEN